MPEAYALANAAACSSAGRARRPALPVAIAIEGVGRQPRQPQDLGDGECALVIGPLGGGKNYSLVVRVLDLDRVTAAPGTTVWHVTELATVCATSSTSLAARTCPQKGYHVRGRTWQGGSCRVNASSSAASRSIASNSARNAASSARSVGARSAVDRRSSAARRRSRFAARALGSLW